MIDPALPRPTASDQFWCYRYVGVRKLGDYLKRDPKTYAPPILLKDWLTKPAEMKAKTAGTSAAALDWLRAEMEELRPSVLQRLGSTSIMDEKTWRVRLDGFALKHHDLARDQITVDWFWLTGDRMADLAIIPNRSPTIG